MKGLFKNPPHHPMVVPLGCPFISPIAGSLNRKPHGKCQGSRASWVRWGWEADWVFWEGVSESWAGQPLPPDASFLGAERQLPVGCS